MAEKDIHQILSAFVDDISTEKSLENYWKKNKTAIKTLQQMNNFLYLELVEKFKNLQIAPNVVEELVQSHYKENKKIVSLEGVLLRLAMDNKISREEFLKYYIGNEINPKFEGFLKENPTWKAFFKKFKKDFAEIREKVSTDGERLMDEDAPLICKMCNGKTTNRKV